MDQDTHVCALKGSNNMTTAHGTGPMSVADRIYHHASQTAEGAISKGNGPLGAVPTWGGRKREHRHSSSSGGRGEWHPGMP